MKIIFMGTPDFAVPTLKKLYDSGYEVQAVFTQPDKPKGRGYKLTPPPVKVLAQEHAEHRGLLRVLPVEGGQVGPGMAGVGGEEQAHVLPLPPYIKHHLVPGGLVELVNLASGHGGTELRGHRREAQCV